MGIDPGMEGRKRALRERMLGRLSRWDAGARAGVSARVVEWVRGSPEWGGARVVAFYASLPVEVDLDDLARGAGDRRLCLPRVTRGGLEFFEVRDLGDLAVGPLGVRTPDPARHARVGVGEIDLFLVPGLAFDRSGGRLGRGRGYYDGVLGMAGRRGLAWGIACGCQIAEEGVPMGVRDAVLDGLVTEEGIWRRAGGGGINR